MGFLDRLFGAKSGGTSQGTAGPGNPAGSVRHDASASRADGGRPPDPHSHAVPGWPLDLPAIGEALLHSDHGPCGSRMGGGGKYFEDARSAWNREDHALACGLLEHALKAELTMPYESCARSILGQIWLKKGDLARAVQEFLKCLELPVRDSDALWMSAVRLGMIYDAAGRSEDAEALAALAAAANRRNLALGQDVEHRIRELVAAALQCAESNSPASDAAPECPDPPESPISTHLELAPFENAVLRVAFGYPQGWTKRANQGSILYVPPDAQRSPSGTYSLALTAVAGAHELLARSRESFFAEFLKNNRLNFPDYVEESVSSCQLPCGRIGVELSFLFTKDSAPFRAIAVLGARDDLFVWLDVSGVRDKVDQDAELYRHVTRSLAL